MDLFCKWKKLNLGSKIYVAKSFFAIELVENMIEIAHECVVVENFVLKHKRLCRD